MITELLCVVEQTTVRFCNSFYLLCECKRWKYRYKLQRGVPKIPEGRHFSRLPNITRALLTEIGGSGYLCPLRINLSVRFFAQGFGFVLLLLFFFSFRLFLRVRFSTKILSKLIKLKLFILTRETGEDRVPAIEFMFRRFRSYWRLSFNNVCLICLRVMSILFNRVFNTTNYPLSLVTFCLRYWAGLMYRKQLLVRVTVELKVGKYSFPFVLSLPCLWWLFEILIHCSNQFFARARDISAKKNQTTNFAFPTQLWSCFGPV